MPRRRTTEGATQARRRAGAKKQPSQADLSSIVSSVSQTVYESLGLETYGIAVDDLKAIVSDMIYAIAEGRSSKLTSEIALKKIMVAKDNIMKALAVMILSRGGRLTREQLEFVVSYAPEAAGKAAPYLYQEAKRLGADDVIQTLRTLWAQYGRATPVECPRCGFRAVTPDLTCMICGAQLTERELKEHMGFSRLLIETARRLHPRLVEEIISAGYVVLDGEIHPPSLAPRGTYALTIHLSKAEKESLRSLIRGAQGPAQGG
ncbi:MAG: hypothetical protein ACP5FT_01280 [Acidilobus sp.]